MRPEEATGLEILAFLGAAIAPLHEPIRPAGEGDWLCEHDEPGQTFQDYLASDPVRPTHGRSVLYIQPLGDMDPPRLEVMAAAAELLGLFYGVPVRVLERMDLAWVPDRARRPHPYEGEQIHSGFVLRLLRRRKPENAFAVLALTIADLWPGKGWNFVFGQASLGSRVGVWSLRRMGSPNSDPVLFLRRTLRTALHETGHMFGILHCTRFECGMNGANHQEETDARLLWFCHEDERKVWWSCQLDPAVRYRQLAEFAERHGLDKEAHFWRASECAVGEARRHVEDRC
jgi:archaemetzincin